MPGLHPGLTWRVPLLAIADWRRTEPAGARLGGSLVRRLVVAVVVVAGLALALVTLPLAGPWLDALG